MRNASESAGHTWAAFAQAARVQANMSQAELAHRLGVYRSTVNRWESGKAIPTSGIVVARMAAATGVDETEALQAAGVLPSEVPPSAPTLEDIELRAIYESDAGDEAKQSMVDYIFRRREEQARERMDAIELALGVRHDPQARGKSRKPQGRQKM